MEDLYLKKTFNSPEVEFVGDTGELSLEGRSIPEDPGEFFEHLIERGLFSGVTNHVV